MCATRLMPVAVNSGRSTLAPLIVAANCGAKLPCTVDTLTPTFSNTLALHHTAGAAAGIVVAFLLSLPRRVVEDGIAAGLALDGLEGGADAVAQGFEPGARLLGLMCPVGHGKSLAKLRGSRQ